MSRTYAQDTSELVKLPEPMQEHMLSNTRDHLASLNKIMVTVGLTKPLKLRHNGWE